VPQEGRGVCAPSLTAAVGTATVIAARTARGTRELPPTERRSVRRRRSAAGTDVLIEAVTTKPGHRTASPL